MVGAAPHSSGYAYILGRIYDVTVPNDSSYVIYKCFPLPLTDPLVEYTPYMSNFISDLNMLLFDIACDGNNIWCATNDPDFPVQCFDPAGTLVDQIPSSTVPSARGLTFESSSQGSFLWVSPNEGALIYKIAVTTGIEEESQFSCEAGFHISTFPNPFSNQLSMLVSGASSETVNLAVVDIAGKIVFQSTTSVTDSWTDLTTAAQNLPTGSYIIVATDSYGEQSSTIAVKMQ